MKNILFLHDTNISLKRGAELTLTQLLAKGKALGFTSEVDLLLDLEQVKQKIQKADLVILSSTSRCKFEIQVLQYILQYKIAYVKIEFDYNFCIRRNILCTVDTGIKNCCNSEKFHLYRNIFANAKLNVFQSPKHYQDHYRFYGEAIVNGHIACPTVEVDKLQIQKKKKEEIPFFGELNYLKGGHAYVDYALAHPDKKFVVYGENKLQRTLPENIKFKAPVTNEEVLKILGQTKTIIIKPVWPEPSGRLAAEAFLSDCELITNDRVGTWSFDFYPNHKAKAIKEIGATISNLWTHFTALANTKKATNIPKFKRVLVRKNYGGLGDIFFTIPAVYKLKEVSESLTYALHPRLVHFFKTHLKEINVISENEVETSHYDKVIELGNYPKFSEVNHHLSYITSKKVKQHAIRHYIDGVSRLHPLISNENSRYPYFEKQTQTKNPYYTIHPGAGFLLKAWPASYFAQLVKLIHDYYPQLGIKIIKGPDDPDITPHLELKNYTLVDGDIDDVAQAVSGALFHVGNDAGITHLAAAFNIPIATIYGPTGPGSWGAFSDHTELIWGKRGNCNLKCNYNVIINCKDRVCLNKVSHQQMFYKVLKLLNKLKFKPTKYYFFNPEYTLTSIRNSYLFTGMENEYLVEFTDNESLEFFQENLKNKHIDISMLPVQFKEVFQGLVNLNLIEAIPEIAFPIKA
ncbi:MAG TPA: glycosyltransferase family 9 protein [Flavobacteriaceae bacterium]|nr:glycosyltransferase family 9 protein [Flavobacteriaceae bacterium]